MHRRGGWGAVDLKNNAEAKTIGCPIMEVGEAQVQEGVRSRSNRKVSGV